MVEEDVVENGGDLVAGGLPFLPFPPIRNCRGGAPLPSRRGGAPLPPLFRWNWRKEGGGTGGKMEGGAGGKMEGGAGGMREEASGMLCL